MLRVGLLIKNYNNFVSFYRPFIRLPWQRTQVFEHVKSIVEWTRVGIILRRFFLDKNIQFFLFRSIARKFECDFDINNWNDLSSGTEIIFWIFLFGERICVYRLFDIVRIWPNLLRFIERGRKQKWFFFFWRKKVDIYSSCFFFET